MSKKSQICNIVGTKDFSDGKYKAIQGKLYYYGYDIEDIVRELIAENRMGFEEIIYLLQYGELPDLNELANFKILIAGNMMLDEKLKQHILRLEGSDMMNLLERSILEMYNFDENPNDFSKENLMRQSLEIISKMPAIIACLCNNYTYCTSGQPLRIRQPSNTLSFAGNFLYMLNGEYSLQDAHLLDIMLVLHAEHSGENNSTYSVRTVASTGTDIYHSLSAGIASLKGKLHGGACLKVLEMFNWLKSAVSDWKNSDEINTYLAGILNRQAFDKSGLIYGIGHSVYTVRDPRAVILRKLASHLAKEKGRSEEFDFLELIATRAIEQIKNKYGGKIVSQNIDFYSGFIYEMIGFPKELYITLFAMSRIVGWCTHYIDELTNRKTLIRPVSSGKLIEKQYTPVNKREKHTLI